MNFNHLTCNFIRISFGFYPNLIRVLLEFYLIFTRILFGSYLNLIRILLEFYLGFTRNFT